MITIPQCMNDECTITDALGRRQLNRCFDAFRRCDSYSHLFLVFDRFAKLRYFAYLSKLQFQLFPFVMLFALFPGIGNGQAYQADRTNRIVHFLQ